MTPPATSPQIYEPVLRRTRLPAPLIEAADVEAAREAAAELTESFLTNPVIEDAELRVEPISPGSGT